MGENIIDSFIREYPDWYQEENELVAGFEFKDFAAVKHVVAKLLELIDAVDHHPTVSFGYNTIEIRTTTHDDGNKITEKDFELAKKISGLISE